MTYGQPHPDAPPVSISWLIEGDTVQPHTHVHYHTKLPNHAQFRMVTPPSDLIIDPALDGYHWRIITWEVVEMPDPIKKGWYKFVKVVKTHYMSEDEVNRFKAYVDFEAAVNEAIAAREQRIAGYKAKEGQA
jgi:hypothetical protein